MAKVRGAVVVDKEGCKGCGLCIASCRSGAIHLKGFDDNEIFAQIYHYSSMKNPDACIGCANCGVVCPDTCIEIYRVKI